MNSSDADRQIDQMIAFIKQEAREKADEINVKTEREFMADKLSLETQSRQTILADHEKMKKNWVIQKKIEKSKTVTESRFATMRHRDNKINELKAEVSKKLAEVAKTPKYRELLRFLIAQGLMTIMEKDVTLQCRKEDLALVQAELPAGIKLFQETMKNSTGVTPSANITIDQKEFLPPAPVEGQAGQYCTGGITLIAKNGQLVCRNTLDARLDLGFEALKPAIRGTLFGVREKIESTEPVKKHGVSLPK